MSRKFTPFLAEEVEIVDTGTDGKGIGKFEQKVIFVENAVPGDVVDILVFRKQRQFFNGRIEHMHKASPNRVEPRCAHFEDCGGCKWQSMSYEEQLAFKSKAVLDALRRIGHVLAGEVLPILPAVSPYNYRNKVEFTFSSRRWVPPKELSKTDNIDWGGALGYHVARFFDKVIQIDECHLHRPDLNAIRNEIDEFAKSKGYSYYNIRHNHGFLRNLVFRNSEASGELLLMLIVGIDKPEWVEDIFRHLESKFPAISHFVWIYNDKKNSSYSDLEPRVWKGEGYLVEELGPWKYRVSPNSFFQTNTSQARQLYDVVREMVGEKRGTIYDLYCGAGSIGIYVNDLADKVVGVEYIEDAVKDAYVNAELNGLKHMEFYSGDMKKVLTPEFVEEHGTPDLVITDPPRAGMDEAVVNRILEMAPARIVYVSCNPATQARDLALLDRMYVTLKVQPVDMFPQTAHVESVALLVRKEI